MVLLALLVLVLIYLGYRYFIYRPRRLKQKQELEKGHMTVVGLAHLPNTEQDTNTNTNTNAGGERGGQVQVQAVAGEGTANTSTLVTSNAPEVKKENVGDVTNATSQADAGEDLVITFKPDK